MIFKRYSKKSQKSLSSSEHPNARVVKVSILFTRIGEIDTINEKFSAEATLFITWSEKVTEANQNCHLEDSPANRKLLWNPKLYIDNAIGDVKEKDVKYRIGKFLDAVTQEWYFEVHMIKRIQGTFFEKLELHHFPFDVQDLSITLTSHRAIDEIKLVQDANIPPKMNKSTSLDKHIWWLHSHVNIKTHVIKNDFPISLTLNSNVSNEVIETACMHPSITMQCRVSRKPGFFVINCLLPTLIITLCVFFSFLMDYERFQYRFSLLFTTMLTSITFRWAIQGRVLPTVSYMTFLDAYCMSSIMFVFLNIVWHGIWLILYEQNVELATQWDRYAFYFFVAEVVTVHIVKLIWFLIAFRKRSKLIKLDKIAILSYTINKNAQIV